MLHDAPCNWEQMLEVDGTWIKFSLASEGTKVSMRAFHALVGLIT